MNCANHPDQAAVAYCRSCGKPLCVSCERPAQGTIYCQEHYPVAQPAGAGVPPGATAAPPPPGASPYGAAGSPYAYGPNPYVANSNVSPGLAFLLGLIPGVGAIYNGQYAKGLIHAVIFGIVISIQSS